MGQNVKQYCQSQFPGTQFTGGGAIHASLSDSHSIKNYDNATVIRYLIQNKIGSKIYSVLQENFGKMDFYLSEAEFNALFMIDSVRHLLGHGDSDSVKEKLKNPSTGNVFHQIALYKDLIGGVRFWCDRNGEHGSFGYDAESYGKPGDGYITIGFRYRLQRMISKDQAMKEIEKTKELVSEYVKEPVKAFEDLPEIGEPVVETVDAPIPVEEEDPGEFKP